MEDNFIAIETKDVVSKQMALEYLKQELEEWDYKILSIEDNVITVEDTQQADNDVVVKTVEEWIDYILSYYEENAEHYKNLEGEEKVYKMYKFNADAMKGIKSVLM
ncbi:MAG: hypothetical protein ACLTDM_15240 [Clostridium butyricum]